METGDKAFQAGRVLMKKEYLCALMVDKYHWNWNVGWNNSMTCTLYLHLEGTTGTYHLNVHVHGKLEILNGESNDLCLSV